MAGLQRRLSEVITVVSTRAQLQAVTSEGQGHWETLVRSTCCKSTFLGSSKTQTFVRKFRGNPALILHSMKRQGQNKMSPAELKRQIACLLPFELLRLLSYSRKSHFGGGRLFLIPPKKLHYDTLGQGSFGTWYVLLPSISMVDSVACLRYVECSRAPDYTMLVSSLPESGPWY